MRIVDFYYYKKVKRKNDLPDFGIEMTRILLHGLEKRLRNETIRFIVGVDTEPEYASNAICYIRTESEFQDGSKEKHAEFWLSLKELDQLGTLLLLASKFWGETLRGGAKYSEEKIRNLKRFWKVLLDSWPEPIV
jgi:hypothetical protein